MTFRISPLPIRFLRRWIAASAVLSVLLVGAAPARLSAIGRHFLWEVKSETGTVYLLGSIHVATDRLYPLDPVIDDAYRRSGALVVEVDLNKVSPERTRTVMMQRGVYNDGRTLESELPGALYERLAGRFKADGIHVEMFAKIKPWFAALTLTSLEVRRLGFDPKYGIDRHFLDLAEGKKPVLQLESFEDQIALLDDLSGHDQELFLLYTMEDIDSLSGQLEELFRAWSGGDAKAVAEILNGSLRDRPELDGMVRSFINERNGKMLQKITEYLEGDRTLFIVVGSGHLVGGDGLIAQLRKRGFAVRQL